MKHKVAELEGALLDAAVAKAEGFRLAPTTSRPDKGIHAGVEYSPSSNWVQGGLIIERERIDLAPQNGGKWSAQKIGGEFRESAATPLIAAMRCFVASKLGEEVKLP